MKKIVSATDLGGAPFFKNDMREVFNSEIWAALEALLSPFNSDTEGLIISGCVFSNNAGNFDMTAGIVYLNGEFMRIAAATNQTYTKYIAPKTPTSDSRTFADGTTHAVVQTKEAELVGSAPGAGQYITINSLTGMLDRVWRPATTETPKLRTKVIEIGDWNMDTTNVVYIAHGLPDWKKIRSISAVIRNDSDTEYYMLGLDDNSDVGSTSGTGSVLGPGSSNGFNSENIIRLGRTTSGRYDGTDFDSTSFNRGWVTVTYEY